MVREVSAIGVANTIFLSPGLEGASPYAIYISPMSGHMYASDARSYATNGYVYEFDRQGKQLNRYLLRGVNPSRIIAM